jgi:hypothetical protein
MLQDKTKTALTANMAEWYFTATGHSFAAILRSGQLSVVLS